MKHLVLLVADEILKMKNPGDEFAKLGLYFLTVMLGLGIHGLVVLPLIYTIACRKLPFR